MQSTTTWWQTMITRRSAWWRLIVSSAPHLVRYNFATPLVEDKAPVTAEPDAMVAAR
jgi:hypothetical protein